MANDEPNNAGGGANQPAANKGQPFGGIQIDPNGGYLLMLRAILVKADDKETMDKIGGGGGGEGPPFGGGGVFTIAIPVSKL